MDDHKGRRTWKWARTVSLIQLIPWRRLCIWHEMHWIRQLQVARGETSFALGNRVMFQRLPSRRRELPVKHHRTPANTIWLLETMVWTNVAQVSLPLHSFTSSNTTSQEVNTRLHAQSPGIHRYSKTHTKFGNLSILHVLKNKQICTC